MVGVNLMEITKCGLAQQETGQCGPSCKTDQSELSKHNLILVAFNLAHRLLPEMSRTYESVA
jgi:hypothetical protein